MTSESSIRPLFHLTPPTGWMNDPVGVTWYDDRYHLFFQAVPNSPQWAPQCQWGHATSPDLLTWTNQPVALEPGDDETGCWSGCVGIEDDGTATMLYTSVSGSGEELGLGRIRAATPDGSTDDPWGHWTPGAVVAQPPPGLGVRHFRDPMLVGDPSSPGDWQMLVGAGLEGGTGAVLRFSSSSLTDWTYAGILSARHSSQTEPVWTGTTWECPQLLALGDRHVLVISVWSDDVTHHLAAATGRYVDGRFEAEHWQRLGFGSAPDLGPYAATAFTDAEGRPCLIAWLRGIRAEDDSWVGAQSLPLQVVLDGPGIALVPHPALAAHRVQPGDACATAWDAEWEAEPGSTLRVVSADGRSLALLSAEASGQVRVETPGGEPALLPRLTAGAAAEHPVGSRVRVVIDRQVLEVLPGPAAYSACLDVRGAPVRLQSSDGSAQCWQLSRAG